MASLTDLQENVLECPICYKRLKPPVETCENGHGICRNCRKSVDICGICRKKFTASSNTLLNQVLETIPVKCKFSSKGCKCSRRLNEIENHEKNCKYRIVNCYCCDQQGISLIRLNDHFDTHRGSKIDLSEWDSVNYKELFPMSHICYYVTNIKTYFLSIFQFRENILNVCVQCIGKNEDEAAKYKYDIKIDQGLPPPNTSYFQRSGLCVPYTYSAEEFLKHENVINLNMKSIFLTKKPLSDGFTFEIQIKEIVMA